MDLSDCSTIKSGVEAFTTQQKRLDVLVNNAGVSEIPLPARPLVISVRANLLT